MGLGSWMGRVVRALTGNGLRGAAPARSEHEVLHRAPRIEEGSSEQQEQERASAWLEAFEAGLLSPPNDVRDARGWDEYWRNQIKYDRGGQWMSDQMASRDFFPEFLERRGCRTVLCAGNGLSFEAISLAMLGFEVCSLDISSVPAEVIKQSLQDPKHLLHQVPGFKVREDGSMAFETPGPIDPAFGPPMHGSERFPPRGGGSMSLVTGDLMDPEACAGPFDAVIERRTVQLFPEETREQALERLVARLAPRGTFISHQHDGRWRPGQPRRHFAQTWLSSHGFELHARRVDEDTARPLRVAWLSYWTG